MAVEFALAGLPPQARPMDRQRRAQFALFALRVELLRHLLGLPSFRELSVMLASSDLMADFCGVRDLKGIRWTSKSTLDRASKLFSQEQLRQMNDLLTEVSANGEFCGQVGLDEPVDASVLLADSTCLEANIHYPVDWVLLKDVSLTLLQATDLIRREGLLNRMDESPGELSRRMNRLCMEMTHSRRRKDARKRRKGVLRSMKKLLKRIGGHARRHRDLLAPSVERTRWSQREAACIMDRVDEKLGLLPKVIHQAHERIIGGRLVANNQKILSVHEPDIHTLVRGKAGTEVEFGNSLYLAESQEGFILDYRLYQGQAPADTGKLLEGLDRQQSLDIETPIRAVVCDRGFDSRKVAAELVDRGIENMICPRDPAKLKECMSQEEFRVLQKRRGGTEARIAILKNNGGRVCRAKGYDHRARAVAFGVLSHNLWWVARKIRQQEHDERLRASA